MSDKKLLAENTIRRFMKLASVDSMTNSFISENFKEDSLEEEVEETNEGINEEEVDLEENIEDLEEQEEDMEIEAELGEEDPMMDSEEPSMADDAPEMGAADMSLTEDEAQVLIDLGKRLEEAMAGDMDDSPDEESEEEGMEDMEDMEDMEPEEDPVAPAKAYMEENQEDLVNEVLKRVTKRLVAKKLKNRK